MDSGGVKACTFLLQIGPRFLLATLWVFPDSSKSGPTMPFNIWGWGKGRGWTQGSWPAGGSRLPLGRGDNLTKAGIK